MKVCGQEFTEEVINKIQETVRSEPEISRRALSLRVCKWLDWKAPNGKPKEMSCRVALLKLQRRGIIDLPEPAVEVPFVSTKKEKELFEHEISQICCDLHELGGVELVKVESRYSKAARVWKSLVQRYHYLGAGPLCGAQIRYLIQSSRYEWLGAVSFE